MNPCLRHSCHSCCLNTEMMLTEADIKRIESLGYEGFYVEKDGFLVLRNVNGRCIFLGDDGLCRIYENRPEGCRYYPFVFDISSETVIRDSDCPYSNEFPEPDGNEVRALAERIMRERLMRMKDRKPY